MAVVQRLNINNHVARRPRVVKNRMLRFSTVVVIAALVVVVAGALAYAGRLAVGRFLSSPEFRINRVFINCTGVRTVSDAEICSYARLASNMNIYATSLEAMRQHLCTHPDIADAQITKRLPDALVIRFTEREPVAIMKTPGDGLDIPIDRNGVVLSERKLHYALHLPKLEGLPAMDCKPGDTISDPRVPAAMRFLDTLLRVQRTTFLTIKSVDFRMPDRITIRSAAIDEIRLGTGYSLETALRLVKTVESLRDQHINARVIDARFADVVVTPFTL